MLTEDAEVQSNGVVRDSATVAAWTIVSRLSGVGRAVTVAAVLGPTYLGNTFQAMNTVPNLAYQLFAGALFAALLVPALVPHVDTRSAKETERIAGGFLGVVVLAFTALSVLAVVAGPFLLRLFALSVRDPAVAARQVQAGWPLLVMLMPQSILYAVAGVGAAVMNAHGRFRLAASASTLENLGVMATVGAVAFFFGSGLDLEAVRGSELALLGIGSTAAVGLHAAAQWWGTWRLGVRLIPRAGWRDPDVRLILRRARSSVGQAWLESLTYLAILGAANAVAGGVVAFLLAMNFFYLPIAVGAQPIVVALRPQLSRLFRDRNEQAFKDELIRAAGLTFFLTIPAAVAFLVLAEPLARVVAVGAMSTTVGVSLVVGSIRALAVGVVGESAFKLATDAYYARGETRIPLLAMVSRTVTSVAVIAIVLATVRPSSVLIGLGIAVSTGTVVGAWHLARRLQSVLPVTGERLLPALLRSSGASIAMIGPAYLVASHPPALPGNHTGSLIGLLAAILLGLLMFLLVQGSWRSPELRYLLHGLRRTR